MALPSDPPAGRDALDIGLLNLLPDAALRAGERRFLAPLRATGVAFRLHRLRPRRIGTAPSGYGAALPGHPLDGLVVTGAEPGTADLADEPFWPELTTAVDWAAAHTRAALFSCLAAHAAVRHLDGVPRRRLAAKCFGLFEVAPAVPAGYAGRVSHSRWHDLDERDLLAAGYDVLGRAPGSVDSFGKRVGGSRFLFLQGHPEYGTGTLGREYRREVERFRDGARDDYPEPPCGYYGARTQTALARVRDAAAGDRSRVDLAALRAARPARRANGAGAAVIGDWLRALAREGPR